MTNFIHLVLYFTVALARAYTLRGTAHVCGSAPSTSGGVRQGDLRVGGACDACAAARRGRRARGLARTTVHWPNVAVALAWALYYGREIYKLSFCLCL